MQRLRNKSQTSHTWEAVVGFTGYKVKMPMGTQTGEGSDAMRTWI